MKTTFALALCLVLVAVSVSADEKYTTKYDNIDLDQILNNDRLFKPYVDCLLKDTRCTPDARELKRTLPDALLTNCEKCSAKQKEGAEKTLRFLAKNKPDVWEQVLAKYDKDNVFRTKYADEARKLGIPI